MVFTIISVIILFFPANFDFVVGLYCDFCHCDFRYYCYYLFHWNFRYGCFLFWFFFVNAIFAISIFFFEIFVNAIVILVVFVTARFVVFWFFCCDFRRLWFFFVFACDRGRGSVWGEGDDRLLRRLVRAGGVRKESQRDLHHLHPGGRGGEGVETERSVHGGWCRGGMFLFSRGLVGFFVFVFLFMVAWLVLIGLFWLVGYLVLWLVDWLLS